MLDRRTCNFHELVWSAARNLGNNAPKIADEIMDSAFPKTISEARIEGADKLLRLGVISEVKRILRGLDEDDKQSNFSDISDEFASYVKDLRSKSYYVPCTEEYVGVARLIAEPDLLDDARGFMRRKGEECLAEAERLDKLYHAVTAESALGDPLNIFV